MNQILIDIATQELSLLSAQRSVLARYPVSTALNGAGEQINSGCTPRGRHRVRIKVGEACPINSVFIGRRATGEIYTPELALEYPGRDWILTRILWLTGCESGCNRGGAVDTLRRYIYLHGCPDSEPMGVARSHGCVRMRNTDILALYDQVERGAPVEIV